MRITERRQRYRTSRAIALVKKDVSQLGLKGKREHTAAMIDAFATREGLKNRRRTLWGSYASSDDYQLVRGNITSAVSSSRVQDKEAAQ